MSSMSSYRNGKVELELVPQGNLAERIRAAGAGLGGVFCPDGIRHPNSQRARKRARSRAGTMCWSSPSIPDLALVKAEAGDRWGNLVYRMAGRNFGPVMAAARIHCCQRLRGQRNWVRSILR